MLERDVFAIAEVLVLLLLVLYFEVVFAFLEFVETLLLLLSVFDLLLTFLLFKDA